jgi:transposase InsO family protein
MNYTPITPTAQVPEEVAEHDVEVAPEVAADAQGMSRLLTGRKPGSPARRGRRTVAVEESPKAALSPQQRLYVLDTWMKSGLPAGDFAPLVGVSKHTLYAWKQRFEAEGPAGLVDGKRGPTGGSRVDEMTKRSILLMKSQHPDWGVDRISALLARGPGLAASPGAVLRVLEENGYQVEDRPTAPHPDHVRSFERARPGDLWQSDLFTFILKRQNQRVYLVAFLDDHSRFVVSYGLHASQSASLVLEVFRAGITSYGTPKEVLTDNGTQYVTWRGKSQFSHECDKRGIGHIVARPRHPETLGKTERFWGTLWRECLETAVFADLGEARLRIGHFIDHYNFQRPHQGIGNVVPADRFFQAAPAVQTAIRERVAANALELAKNGVPKAPFYLTGNVAGQPFSVHAEGEQVILTKGEQRAAIALDPRPEPVVPPPAPMPLAPPPASPAPAPAHAPQGVPASAWTGAEVQPMAGSVLDRWQHLLRDPQVQEREVRHDA